MKNKTIIFLLFLLPACTTPKTVMKNDETGQVVMCGGNVSSSLSGGAIGYHIQKSNDEDCVSSYRDEGFHIISVPDPK